MVLISICPFVGWGGVTVGKFSIEQQQMEVGGKRGFTESHGVIRGMGAPVKSVYMNALSWERPPHTCQPFCRCACFDDPYCTLLVPGTSSEGHPHARPVRPERRTKKASSNMVRTSRFQHSFETAVCCRKLERSMRTRYQVQYSSR